MIFRNAVVFRFPTLLQVLPGGLDTGLGACRLKPVGPMELATRGFVSPTGKDEDEYNADLAFWLDEKTVLLAVGTEERMLPSAVVNAELAKRLDEIERKEGRKPGGRARKRLKDELITELLPRAFVKPGVTYGYLDLQRGLLVVDTTSGRKAESFVSEVRRALGSFPALPLNAEVSPSGALTRWLGEHDLPEDFTLGDHCVLEAPIDSGERVTYVGTELLSEDIALQLESGMLCSRLALQYRDQASFVVGDDLVIRKLKLSDAALGTLENVEREDLEAEIAARFALMAGTFGAIFDTLEGALKLSKVEG